ncbi:MAG: hypothetical protein HY645_04335 [Acidobacteria bacterium]|nr:hypothetical protein [Acidobacteriota bacterium]
MTTPRLRTFGFLVMSLLLYSSCSRQQKQEEATAYPKPRLAAYASAPKSVEEILPFARSAIRQEGGRTPLGLVEPGEHVIIFAGSRSWLEPNFLVLKALASAFRERNIRPLFVLPPARIRAERESEFIETQRREAPATGRMPPSGQLLLGTGYTSEKGYMEARNWVMGWSNPAESREWLRQRNSVLYEKMFPKQPLQGRVVSVSSSVLEEAEKNPLFKIWAGDEKEFLDQYPVKVDAIFGGSGGREGWQLRLGPHSGKFYGNFIFDSYQEVMSKISTFPGDLWRLIEERTLEPIAWVEEAHVTDPEGTDFTFRVTEDVAKMWAEAAYLPAHLFLIPHGATTLIPNKILYPKLKRWLKPALPDARGILVSTRNHVGVYPRMEVYLENSRVKEVRGGGEYGEALRAFLDHPNLNKVKNPYYDVEGYWFLFEGAVGTNPKAFIKYEELMEGRQGSEREAAGVIHWALGAQAYSDDPGREGTNDKFRQTYNVPRGHGFHMHNLMTTYRARIRGSQRWVTLVDKGQLASLDHAEIRALASRYGEPDEVLQREWVPDFPGINSPGDYQKDYAENPWRHMSKIIKQAEDGTYPYLVK